MDKTTHYGLNKPAQDEFYDVDDFNKNADAIDAGLFGLSEAVANADAVSAQGAIWCGIAGGSGNSFVLLTGRDMAGLGDGQRFSFYTDRASPAPLIYVDSLDSVALKKGDGSTAAKISPGVQTIVYTKGFFFAASGGGGGDFGTAGAAQVLEGYSVGTENGIVSGSMPNKGAVSQSLASEGQSYAVPAGYHDGKGTVKAAITNLAAANVKQGVKVGGIDGNFTNDADAAAGDIVKDKKAYAKGSLLTGTLALSGNAAAADVVKDKTFYGNSLTKQTGTLALSGNAAAADVVKDKTFYGGSLTKQTGTLALSGDAAAGNVLSGKTFYGNSLTKQTGSMPNKGSPTFTPGAQQSIPAGYYSGGTIEAIPGGARLFTETCVFAATNMAIPKGVTTDVRKIRYIVTTNNTGTKFMVLRFINSSNEKVWTGSNFLSSTYVFWALPASSWIDGGTNWSLPYASNSTITTGNVECDIVVDI